MRRVVGEARQGLPSELSNFKGEEALQVLQVVSDALRPNDVLRVEENDVWRGMNLESVRELDGTGVGDDGRESLSKRVVFGGFRSRADRDHAHLAGVRGCERLKRRDHLCANVATGCQENQQLGLELGRRDLDLRTGQSFDLESLDALPYRKTVVSWPYARRTQANQDHTQLPRDRD